MSDNPCTPGTDEYDAWDRQEAAERDTRGAPAGDQPAEGDKPVRRLRLTPASAIRPRKVEWLWTNRIPVGEVTLTPGRAGIGKSTFHAWLIAGITRGTVPGIHFGQPKACIISATEDSWERTIVPRLLAAGADLTRVYRVDVVTAELAAGRLSLPADGRLLAQQVTESDVVLVSLDPLLSTLHASIDTHRNAEVRTAMEPLSRLADATGAAILGNAHFNKSNGSDPLALITGSAAFGEVIRAAIGFARDPDAEDGSCVMTQIKNNLGRLDLPSLGYTIASTNVDTADGPTDVGRFVMLGETDRTVSDILGEIGNGGEEHRAERDEAADWLIGYLTEQGGESLAAEVVRAAGKDGIASRTLQRARTRAGVTSERRGFGRGAMWVLDPAAIRAHSRRSRQGSDGGADGANVAPMSGGVQSPTHSDRPAGAPGTLTEEVNP